MDRKQGKRKAACISDPCEFLRIGNDTNDSNLLCLHVNGQNGEDLVTGAQQY